MKKVLLLVLSFIFIFTILHSDEFDFRQVKLGMSKEQLKKIVKHKKIMETNAVIVYRGKVFELVSRFSYYFSDKKLYKVMCKFVTIYVNKNKYIKDFESVRSALIDKYGAPARNIVIWENDFYRKKPQKWGLALSLGHVIYLSSWEKENFFVTISLKGDNYSVDHYVTIESK